MVAMVSGIVIRRAKTRRRKPVDLFIDECQNFIGDNITFILNELRKYGLHLTLCQQYVGQAMTPQITKSVLSNTSIKLMGASDHGSLQPMSNTTGIAKCQLQKIRGTGNFLIFNKDTNFAAAFMVPKHYVKSRSNNKFYMSPIQWHSLRDHIISSQYRKVVSAKDHTEEDEQRAELSEVIGETRSHKNKFRNPFSNLM